MSDKNKPVSGTREWAKHSANVILGCSHDCRYCYSRASASRFNRVESADWMNEKVMRDRAVSGFARKKRGRIMFPTQHDITPENLDVTGKALRQMLMAGNEVLVVSKPHLSVIETLCRDLAGCKELILFRFTIGSMDDDTLALWEPGAPKFAERFASLQHAHDAGYFTSVSMEPLLETDEDAVVALVEKLQPFITDSIWIGKMNQVRARLSVNGFGKDETIQEAADAIIASQTDARIRSLYARMEGWDKLRWKESIKKVVGLEIPTEAGLDV